jgi:hypothetical protein
MTSALDAFREQREVAEAVKASVAEVVELLGRVQREVDLLVNHKELHAILQQQERWLDRLDRTMVESRRWREEEARRFWPGMFRRWTIALIFALASAAAAGVGYARITAPYVAELAELHSRTQFGTVIAERVITMTPAERRQFDALMKWRPQSR